MSKLKPCPFCGGEASLQCAGVCAKHTGESTDYFVSCRGCSATTMRYFDTPVGAIAAWNLRPTPENNPLTLEQLRNMDGEPVYVVYQSIDGIKHGTWAVNWNAMKSASNGYVNFKHKNYEKQWIAYARKPKQEGHYA
ncbi:MAG: Lar family restriction alleviation protein [Clostridium sp.]|uniref:Lar family restriction alleviation protein n=1 Tax=Clostridium sp. TaxID=1506 RepID=UPI00291158B6|nr:Lar family restriction alleviation protein [Clostridium sp.]MDU7339337.1 Lar family restriction alleviation protein [Clostridium sp.]